MIRLRSRTEAFNCRETVRCIEPGCERRTRDGKPFCPDHVELHPYVLELRAMLDQQQAELEAVARRGARAVDPDGLAANELLLQLKLYGERTVERLSRDLQLDVDVVTAYVRALAKAGRLSLAHTRRGHLAAQHLGGEVHIPAPNEHHGAAAELRANSSAAG